jgi:S1-C subfamily serine protease
LSLFPSSLSLSNPAPWRHQPLRAIQPSKILVGKGHGSGVYIGSNLVLTAAHVVAGADDGKITVKTESGNILDGEVLWSSKARDVSLIRVSGVFGLSPAVLSCTTPKIGDAIHARGNPLSALNFSAHGAGWLATNERWGLGWLAFRLT